MRLVTLVAARALAYLSLSLQLPRALCAVANMSSDDEVCTTFMQRRLSDQRIQTKQRRRAIVAFFVRHRTWPRVVEPIWVYMQRPDSDSEMDWLRSLLASPDSTAQRQQTAGRRLLQPLAPPPTSANHTRSTSIPSLQSASGPITSNTHRRSMTSGGLEHLANETIWQPLAIPETRRCLEVTIA